MTIITDIIATSVGNVEFQLRQYRDVKLELTTQFGDSSEALYLSKEDFKSLVAALDEFREVLKEKGIKNYD